MDGVRRIDRIVAEFHVWLDDSFPFAKMKVRVIERDPGNLLAVANVGVRNIKSREREYISGLAGTVEAAVNDLLVRFIAGVRENTPMGGLTEADFDWSAHEDF